jgi:starch phosphorylase
MTGTYFRFEVRPQIPEQLERLNELANDLLYSWDRNVRGLFFRLDPALWDTCGHNPRVFLRQVSQKNLEDALDDQIYMEDYNKVMFVYDNYHRQGMRHDIKGLEPGKDLVAYFCAEFGFHESLPIYSGGLGILAGDHCKAASDLGIPFIAIGLLYRQGYFTQTIDSMGNQIAHYMTTRFDDLPLTLLRNDDGSEMRIDVPISGRRVYSRIWRASAGRIQVYLLDTDLPENSEHDRAITHQLYGGDSHTRIQQEILLGLGGVRALKKLDFKPTVWHINEGHAAFQILERCRKHVDVGMDFDSALELVAGNTVFTTHTPVSAGHDIFDRSQIEDYLKGYIKKLNVELDRFMELGSSPSNQGGFNMTALALRGSRFHNGVSRIHGGVASDMEGYVWPEVPHEENPIDYITNGVHVPTFLAKEWINLFDMRYREWRSEMNSEEFWDCVDDIPDHRFWSLRQSLKSDLLADMEQRLYTQHRRNGCSEAQIDRITAHMNPAETDTLLIGFARRFATYKRATLLFSDPERLKRLLKDPDRPVVLIFAGKAHPNDLPGQQLIKVIHEYSRDPEFEGHVILLEGYDMSLARKLVSGVDVWLNTPAYPLEASGTSGQKAGINGVINLSVLDGWWGEGFTGDNGWGINPHGDEFDPDYRNSEEARDLIDTLESQVIPLYYSRDGHGYPEGWVQISKASMRTCIPRFNATRMFVDYIDKFYSTASRHAIKLSANNAAGAIELAAWKKKVDKAWPAVSVRQCKDSPDHVRTGDSLPITVCANLDKLTPDDIRVECLIYRETADNELNLLETFELEASGANEQKETLFHLDMQPGHSGLQIYRIRIYPYHKLQAHPYETGHMIWL